MFSVKKMKVTKTKSQRSSMNTGDIGRNHPDEQLKITEPLRSGSVPVHSTLPITRARKY